MSTDLSPENQRRILLVLQRQRARTFDRLFPDETTTHADGSLYHARTLYPKQMEFFRAGAKYRERMARCANRVGKTMMAGYEIACHATGLYPDWWEGRRFKKPVSIWAAGKTFKSTQETVQLTLFGSVDRSAGRKRMTGTGVVPADALGQPTWSQGVQDFIDTQPVRHVSGGWSEIGLKAYAQGRDVFEGTAKEIIWLDEEPPMAVYGECLIRTATTDGMVMVTFTPLEGISEVVKSFMPGNRQSEAA